MGTVDAFQGGEADAVIISAVRAPGAGRDDDVGFVADARRFNVALTRAKHALLVVCHAATLRYATSNRGQTVDHVRGLIEDADARGDVVDETSLQRRGRDDDYR